jgi:hypothetical protein
MKSKYILFIAFVFLCYKFDLYASIKFAPIFNAQQRVSTTSYKHENINYIITQKSNDYKSYEEYYLGNNYFLYAIPDEKINSNSSYYYIIPNSKIAIDIDKSKNVEQVQIIYSKLIDNNEFLKTLTQFEASITEHYIDRNIIKVQIATKYLDKLAELPFIYSISKEYQQKNILYYDSYIMNRLSEANFPSPYGYNLNGEGMKIGIWDDGIIAPHINLEKSRVFNIDKAYNTSPYYNHPTYVAGAAAMNNNGNYFQKAAASKATIYAWDYDNDVLSEIKNGVEEYQLNVTNHSYNFGQTECISASGLYIPEASEIDKIAYTNKDVVHVVAVGNTAHFCAVNDTFYSTDIGFQGAKNTITVGYLYRDERLVETSGRGPTTDGRLKPELVTKGFAYSATSPGNGFTTVYGSSFAAPQIAGIASILQQKYKQQTGSLPPSSLVKATLCNTAQDLFYKGIDYASGFGRPDVGKALQNIADNRFVIDNIQNNEIKVHTFTVPEHQDYLALTIAWTDLASFPFQDTILVNDLDIKLVNPNNDTILPWVLNPNNYHQLATRGIDKLNNIEHITLENIFAGEYKIIIKGAKVISSNQEYALTYYTSKKGIDIVYPNGGETLDAGGSTNITWNQYGVNDTLNVYYSLDSGQTWTFINKVYSTSAFLAWTLPANVASKSAMIKIICTDYVDSSDLYFNIISRPNANNLTITTCDKSANLSWTAIAGTQYYTIYLFENEVWRKVDTTSNLKYDLTNLVNGNAYYAAITVSANGIEGNRSNAKGFTSSFTVCNTTNDIGVYEIAHPIGGRQLTSTALTNQEHITFIIKNYGTNTVSNFNIVYQVNGGSLLSELISRSINTNDTIHFKTNNIFDFSSIGTYNIVARTASVLDTIKRNDTLKYTLKHVPNNAITLPWKENFESNSSILSENTFAINNMQYADYWASRYARWRTNAGNLFAHSGSNALTLDNTSTTVIAQNQHIITLNLNNYIDSIVYLDFSYLSHNETNPEDTLFARGNDTLAWIPIYNLFENKLDNGIYKNVKAINLQQLLKTNNNQNFSTSTQLKIKTQSTNAATGLSTNGGYSFDDICLYTANNDVQNISANTLRFPICLAQDTFIPITIIIKNNSNQVQNNIDVAYSVNEQNTVVETITNPILPYDTMTYVFNQPLHIMQVGKYDIRTIVQHQPDMYKTNDTSKTLTYIANQYIQTLPYLNTFESEASLIPYNINNSSWTYGTPSKYYTRAAAEDKKAWTNSLYGNYNFNENSELYLGCFNLNNLNTYPTIAMHHLQDIQSLYDSAWAEYSLNAITWNKLGCANCGTNWYNNTTGIDKWDRTLVPWQVASTKIVIDPSIDKSKVLLRIKFVSNSSVVGEGLAIDDLHIYAGNHEIAPSDSVFVVANSSGNGWIDILKNDLLIAQIFDDNKNLGNINVGYKTTNNIDYYLDRTIVPRNWSILPQNNIEGNYKIRLYLLNNEYLKLINNDPNANSMNDIAALRYNGFNIDVLKDNNYVNGLFDFIHQDSIHFVPFDNGYYVEINTNKFGEFYLVGSQVNPVISNIPNIIKIDAQQINNDTYLEWQTEKDANIRNYVVQYSLDGIHFYDIDSIVSSQNNDDTALYNFIHNINAVNNSILFYRIKANTIDGKIAYSLVDSIKFDLPTALTQNSQYIKSYFSNNNNIVVENKNVLKGTYNVMLLQLDGKIIHQQKSNIENGNYDINITKNLLSKNIYLLKIFNNSQTYFSKLLKP